MKGRRRSVLVALAVAALAAAATLGISSQSVGAKPKAAPKNKCPFPKKVKHMLPIQF